ncbi:MAG: nitroreductase [Caulobacteraceae bacterium]
MPSTLPPEPEFGAPCVVEPSPDTLNLLAGRRSSSAQTLIAPAPDAEQLADLLRLAARAPDHGKLNPWRFVILEGAAKARFVEALRVMVPRQPNPDKAAAALGKISAPPLTVAVISAPKPGKKPIWEQELSAGAVCTLMLVAADAMGFGANWITDWYSYDPEALRLLGAGEGEKVAGFVHIGTCSEAPLERARPDLAEIVSRWG